VRRLQAPPTALLFTAPFLSPRTREVLAGAGASYVDMTGNLRGDTRPPSSSRCRAPIEIRPSAKATAQSERRPPDPRGPRPVRFLAALWGAYAG